MITATDLLIYLMKGQPVPAWVTSTAYKVGDYVLQSTVVYECIVAHTAAALFSTDLAAGKWSTSGQLHKSVNSAIADVISYCGRDFRQGTYTEEIYALCSNKLFIKNWPIDPADDKITVLQYLDESLSLSSAWTDIIDVAGDTINNSVYRKNYEIRLLKGYTFYTDKIIKITYINLMTSYDGLNEVIECTLDLAALDYKNSDVGGSHLAKTSLNLGGASAEGQGLNISETRDMILKRLDKHRNIPI